MNDYEKIEELYKKIGQIECKINQVPDEIEKRQLQLERKHILRIISEHRKSKHTSIDEQDNFIKFWAAHPNFFGIEE